MQLSKMRYLIFLSLTFLWAQEIRIVPYDTTALEEAVVPSLIGYTVERAEAILAEARLRVGHMTYVEYRAEPRTVVKQGPSAGARVPVNSEVHLTIAMADPYRYVIVPLVVGQKLQRAKVAIEKEQLRVGKVEEEFNEGDPGTVIRQTPKGETRVRVNTPVDLVVAGRKSNLLPWVIGGSLLVLGVGGYLMVRHTAKSRKGPKPTRPHVRFEPKKDFGEHQVDSKDTLQSGLEICFLPFGDIGIQTIDTEGTLIIDERGVDE